VRGQDSCHAYRALGGSRLRGRPPPMGWCSSPCWPSGSSPFASAAGSGSASRSRPPGWRSSAWPGAAQLGRSALPWPRSSPSRPR